MSTVTVAPGATIEFDPNDKRVIIFDFDQLNLAATAALSSYVITITSIVQSGVTALTSDNAGLVAAANRKVSARFLATTATLGDLYQVACRGITNETPPQEKEYSIFILVQDK